MPRPTKRGPRYTADDWRLIRGCHAFGADAVGVIVDAIGESIRDGTPLLRALRNRVEALGNRAHAKPIGSGLDHVVLMLRDSEHAARLNAPASFPEAAAFLMHVLVEVEALHRHLSDLVAPEGARRYGPGAPRGRRRPTAGGAKPGRPRNRLADDAAQYVMERKKVEPACSVSRLTREFLAAREQFFSKSDFESLAAQVRSRLAAARK